MNKTQIIKKVRDLVAHAESKEALLKMVTFLDSDPQYRKMAVLARLAQSKYLRANQNLNAGIISQSQANLDFNLASRTLLKLAEDLEQNNFYPKGYAIQPSIFSRKLVQILTVITVLMTVALSFRIYIEFFKQEPIVTVQSAECPVFDEESEFNILILPFESASESAIGAHTYIKRRIDELADQYDLDINIEIFKDYFEENDSPGIKEASTIGTECGARLVIWGVSEATNEGKIVSTSFKYLGEDKFKFTKLVVNGSASNAIDTISSFSSIQTGGVLTAEIESLIYMVFGLIANRSHNYNSAVAILEEAQLKNMNLHGIPTQNDTSITTLLADMILADSYLATDQNDKALMTYDTILKAHPNYSFALNNRGILNLQQENYSEAIQDLETQLAIEPDNDKALIIKAKAHRKLEQLDKANNDLKKAEQIAPTNPILKKEQERVDSLKVEKRKIEKATTEVIQKNPKSVNAYIERGEARASLGENKLALEESEKALEIDANNLKAYIIQTKMYQKEKDTVNLNKVLKEVTRKGIDLNNIKRVRPLMH